MRISDWSSDVCSSDLECGTLGKFVILTLIGHITEFLGGESDSIEIDHTNPRLLGLTKQRLRRGEINSIQNVIPDCPLRVDQPDLISDSIDRGIQISLSLLQLHLSGLSILTKIRKLKFRQRCVDLIKGLSLVDCVSVVGLHLLVGLTHPLNDRVVALKLIHQEILIIIQVEKSPDSPSKGGHRLNLKGLIRNYDR